MIIAAVSDIHAPLKLKWFHEKLQELKEEPEIFLLLGDLVERNQHYYLKKIYYLIRLYFPNVKIYSVFGNNEWYEYREMYKKEYSFMNWLDDEYVNLGDYILYGTEGILDHLTTWMRKNFPQMKNIFEARLQKIKKFLEEIDKPIIFASHYAPVCRTVFGDPAPYYYLCSKKLENIVINNEKIRYVFHGHAHLAKITYAEINNKKIYNVSAYATNKITLVNV